MATALLYCRQWALTKEQRESIANGADILLEVFHFKQPLAPVRMFVADRDGQERYRNYFEQFPEEHMPKGKH